MREKGESTTICHGWADLYLGTGPIGREGSKVPVTEKHEWIFDRVDKNNRLLIVFIGSKCIS